MRHLTPETPFVFWRILAVLAVFGLLLSACGPSIRSLPQTRHNQTQWVVEASLPLDALAFLNALTGDPLVGSHYVNEVVMFKSKFSTPVTQAVQRLKVFRDSTVKGNLNGFLGPWFVIGKPQSLDELIRLAGSPDTLKKAMVDYDSSGIEMNVYNNESAFQNFQKAAPDVALVLQALKDNGFETYWNEQLQPRILQDVEKVKAYVEGNNIVPQIEAVDGFGLPSDTVTVSLLHFEWPYGHHILGTHYSTIPEDTAVLQSTIHELLHNPFNNTDPAFWNAANSLKNDPVIYGAFQNHDPKWGYNDWPYYVAEDSVRALEQYLSVKMGLGERWDWTEDGGMHKLSAVLYALMKQEGFQQNGESYQAWFIRMVKEGKLKG